jgi:thioredoxin 1
MLSPVLKKVAGDVETKTGSGRPIDLVTVDTDVHGALAQKHQVRGSRIPPFICRRDPCWVLINELVPSFLHSGRVR